MGAGIDRISTAGAIFHSRVTEFFLTDWIQENALHGWQQNKQVEQGNLLALLPLNQP